LKSNLFRPVGRVPVLVQRSRSSDVQLALDTLAMMLAHDAEVSPTLSLFQSLSA